MESETSFSAHAAARATEKCLPMDTKESDGDESNRGQWTRQIEYVLSLLGYCVGAGNVWRFPYLCNRNGGGAFLIPYFIFLIVIAVPLFSIEVAIGQYSGRSALQVWSICPLFKGIGFTMIIVSSISALYFNIIIAWILYYLVNSFSPVLPWSTCDNAWNTPTCFVANFTGESNVTNVTNGTYVTNSSVVVQLNTSYVYTMFDNVINTSKPNSTYVIGTGNESRIMSAVEEFWQFKTLNISDGIENMGSLQWHMALCMLGAWFLIFLCLIKGIKSLGKVVYVTALLPYVLLTVFVVRSLMLPGARHGVIFYLTPDFNRLFDVQVWVEALLHIFFSVGMCWGGLVTLASYNRFNNNCIRIYVSIAFLSTKIQKGSAGGHQTSALPFAPSVLAVMVINNHIWIPPSKSSDVIERQQIITAGEGAWDSVFITLLGEATSFFAGFAVFSILGFMSLQIDVPISEVVKAGPGLAFIVYPEALGHLPIPQLWAVLFFLMLLTIGLDSVFGMVETLVTALIDGFPHVLLRKRMVTTAVICSVCFIIGLPLSFQGGVYVFQLLDWYVTVFNLLVVGFIECIIVGWIYGADRFGDDIELMLGKKTPFVTCMKVLWRFIAPSLLVLGMVATAMNYKPPTYGYYHYPGYIEIIGWSFSLMPLLPVPICMFTELRKAKGTFWQRIKVASSPDDRWIPKCKKAKEKYFSSAKTHRRTFKFAEKFKMFKW